MKIVAVFVVFLFCLNMLAQTSDMVLIAGGKFMMGKNANGADFTPAHHVSID